MTHDDDDLLEELFRLDPALRPHREQLIPLIERLRQSKPDVKPDAAFVSELRRHLLAHADTLQTPSSTWQMLRLPSAVFALLLIVIALPLAYLGIMRSLPQTAQYPSSGTPLFAYNLKPAPANAFGSLKDFQPGAQEQLGRGGGGPVTAPATPSPMAQATNDSTMAAPSAAPSLAAPMTKIGGTSGRMMINPQIERYEFSYSGAMLPLADATVSVLRRERGMSLTDLSSLRDALNLGTLDLSTFHNTAADSISLIQQGDFGYLINVQLRDGSVNISQNWETWPHPEMNCKDDACYQKYRTKAADIPSDDALIRIADAFVAAHKIDLTHYGKPEIDASGKNQIAGTPSADMPVYFPDSMSVIYPLQIEGKTVYDQGGMKAGIRVNVSVREKKVSDVWGIQSQTYSQSSYNAVTSQKDITDYLSHLGEIPTNTLPQDAKVHTTTVTLGAPELGYMTYFKYDNATSQELLVPALFFPAAHVSGSGSYWQQRIAVPLAKELLQQPNGGTAYPMKM